MRKHAKEFRIFIAAIAITMLTAITSFAAGTFSDNWYVDEETGKWRLLGRDGYDVVNAWVCDDAVPANGKEVWYLIDGSGYMYSSGLVQDTTGNYYSLETNHNGYYGMLRHQSGTYDGVYLDLEQSHNGSFGAIKNQAGIDALKAKYGVEKFDLDNGNIVYTSNEKMTSKAGGGAATGSSSTSRNDAYVSRNDGTWPDYVLRVLDANGKVDWDVVKALYSTPSKELTCEELEDQFIEAIDIVRYDKGYAAPLVRNRALEDEIVAFKGNNNRPEPTGEYLWEKYPDTRTEVFGANGYSQQPKNDSAYDFIYGYRIDWWSMKDYLAICFFPYVSTDGYTDKVVFNVWTDTLW